MQRPHATRGTMQAIFILSKVPSFKGMRYPQASIINDESIISDVTVIKSIASISIQ